MWNLLTTAKIQREIHLDLWHWRSTHSIEVTKTEMAWVTLQLRDKKSKVSLIQVILSRFTCGKRTVMSLNQSSISMSRMNHSYSQLAWIEWHAFGILKEILAVNFCKVTWWKQTTSGISDSTTTRGNKSKDRVKFKTSWKSWEKIETRTGRTRSRLIKQLQE